VGEDLSADLSAVGGLHRLGGGFSAKVAKMGTQRGRWMGERRREGT